MHLAQRPVNDHCCSSARPSRTSPERVEKPHLERSYGREVLACAVSKRAHRAHLVKVGRNHLPQFVNQVGRKRVVETSAMRYVPCVDRKVADPEAEKGQKREVTARVGHEGRGISGREGRTLLGAGRHYRSDRVLTDVIC